MAFVKAEKIVRGRIPYEASVRCARNSGKGGAVQFFLSADVYSAMGSPAFVQCYVGDREDRGSVMLESSADDSGFKVGKPRAVGGTGSVSVAVGVKHFGLAGAAPYSTTECKHSITEDRQLLIDLPSDFLAAPAKQKSARVVKIEQAISR